MDGSAKLSDLYSSTCLTLGLFFGFDIESKEVSKFWTLTKMYTENLPMPIILFCTPLYLYHNA